MGGGQLKARLRKAFFCLVALLAAFANGARGEVSLLPTGGTNLVFGAWEYPMPFVEAIIRPQIHDFTAYDRCVLDYVYLGEIGEPIHMYFAGDKEVFGKDDVLATDWSCTIWLANGAEEGFAPASSFTGAGAPAFVNTSSTRRHEK